VGNSVFFRVRVTVVKSDLRYENWTVEYDDDAGGKLRATRTGVWTRPTKRHKKWVYLYSPASGASEQVVAINEALKLLEGTIAGAKP